MKFKFMGKKYRIREGSPLWLAIMVGIFFMIGCCPNL